MQTMNFPGTLLLLLVSYTTLPANASEKPAWCSKKALTDTEITICNDKNLSKADRLLDQMYRAVLSFNELRDDESVRSSDIIADQHNWIEKRNTLSDKAEILDAYSTRIKILTRMVKVNG